MTIHDLYMEISIADRQGKLSSVFPINKEFSTSMPPRFERIPSELESHSLDSIRNILDSEIETREYIWENILTRIDPACLNDELISYLLDKKIALITLGHMDLSDKWLRKVGKYVEEAIFTLGKRIYLSDSYSMADFARFIKDNSNESLLTILLNAPATSLSKRSCLIFACNRDGSREMNDLCSSIIRKEKLLLSDSPCELENAFMDCSDENVLLALAQNIFTPIQILSSLKNVSNVKNARVICSAAQITSLSKEVFRKYTNIKSDS